MRTTRRGFLSGLLAVAAPAIVRPGLIMPINSLLLPSSETSWKFYVDGRLVESKSGWPGGWVNNVKFNFGDEYERNLTGEGLEFGSIVGPSTFTLEVGKDVRLVDELRAIKLGDDFVLDFWGKKNFGEDWHHVAMVRDGGADVYGAAAGPGDDGVDREQVRQHRQAARGDRVLRSRS